KRFLKTHPNHVGALKTMAFLHRRYYNPEEGLRCYQRALEIQPDNDEVRKDYAEALLHLKQPREALQQYQVLEARKPRSVKVAVGLARCYRNLGEFAKARQLLLALPNRDANFECLSELGQLAWKEGRAGEAEQWLKKAQVIYAHNSTNLYTMYLCLQQEGKVRQAKDYQRRFKKAKTGFGRLNLLPGKLISNEPKTPPIPSETCRISRVRHGPEPAQSSTT